MKKYITLFLAAFLILLTGCSNQQKSGITAQDGYFDASAQTFLNAYNQQIVKSGKNYPQMPSYSTKKKNGDNVDYYSDFDRGGALRVTENAAGKIVEITLLLDTTKASEQGANYCGYYLGEVDRTLNPSMSDTSISVSNNNLAINNVQPMARGNLFCVIVDEDGIRQCRIYPLPKK